MAGLAALPTFSESVYRSINTTDWAAGAANVASGDLDRPDVLAAALAARAFRGEVILFTFDVCAVSDALNTILLLRNAGFEHFIPLTDGEATCTQLERAAARVTARAPCFWSSWSSRMPGWAQWGSGAGCVSALVPQRSCVLEQLYAMRYHVAGAILARGANVLFTDLDAVLLQDPYAQLKAAPLSGYNFIFTPDIGAMPANGGLWYAQATTAGAGAQWVVAEVARRTEAVVAVPIRRRSTPPMDQVLLGDVLATATIAAGEGRYGLMCRHPTLRELPMCTNLSARALRPMNRLRLPDRSPPMQSPYADAAAGVAPRRAQRRARGVPTAALRVAGSERVERAALAPPWLLSTGWDPQLRGLFTHRRAAVVHLLGVRCRWCLNSDDVDHGAKWEWQHLSGMWAGRAYLNATRGGARRTDRGRAERRAAEADRITNARCLRRGRARVLPYGARLVSAPADLVRVADAANDDGAAARELIRRLIVLGTLLGRVAVLPSFNCSAPWIRKQARAYSLLPTHY